MESQNNTFKYTVVALALLIGTIIGVCIDPYLPASLSNSKKSYQLGFDAAKTLAVKSSYGALLQAPDDVRILSGAVTGVDGNRVTFHLKTISPFDDPTLSDRTAIIVATTTIARVTMKDPQVYQAELAAYLKATSQKGTVTKTSTPPESFTAVRVTISDIKAGDNITVFTDANVKTIKEFPVGGIQILPKS